MDIQTAAKAWIAATVTFVGVLTTAYFGYEIPVGVQEVIVTAVLAVATWLATWATPNKSE